MDQMRDDFGTKDAFVPYDTPVWLAELTALIALTLALAVYWPLKVADLIFDLDWVC